MHSYVAEARDNIRCDPLFGVTWRRNVSGTSCKLLQEDVTTYQERLASHLTKMLRRSRKVLQVTWRVTTYQERSASYLKKMLQRIRDVLQVTYRRCYNVSGTFWQVTWRRCCNVSGTSCKFLEQVVPTYQERLTSYLKKMLQRSRNIWQVTWRRRYNVAGTSCMLLEEVVPTYQGRLASYFKKSYNVSGTFGKFLTEYVTS